MGGVDPQTPLSPSPPRGYAAAYMPLTETPIYLFIASQLQK